MKDVAPYLFSIALHAVIIILLIFVMSLSNYRLENSSQSDQPVVVHAAVVNAEEVQAQVQAIQSQEQQKQVEQQRKLQELQAQAEAVRQAKLAEEQRLAQIKAEQQKVQAQKQRIAEQMQEEQQRLAQLKLAEQQKQEKEKQAKALAIKNQKEAEAKQAAEKAAKEWQIKQQALQQQLMQQQMAAEKQQLLQAKLSGIIDQYRARILEAIRNQWIIPEGADPNSYCIFNIELSSAGVVIRAQLIRSSGNAALDRAAETAIHKASPLPVPTDPAAFASFQRFNLKMTPHEVD